MKIHTVLGEIEPSELGLTACHEHLIWTVPEPYADEDPDLGFDSVPAAVAELRHFKSAGGRAVVEMTTPEIGRCPLELRQISQAAGVHVIAASGHHKQKFSAPYLAGIPEDEIVRRIIADVVDGMDGTPVRAGVIKAGSSLNSASESERLVIRSVGRAHAATGAPVSTHTEGGTFAVEQAALLLRAGVVPEKLLIGHLDRNQPLQVYLDLAQMGVYLGFDQVGKEKYWPDEQRVQLILKLAHAGYAQQILLSGDTARRTAWHTYNPHTEGMAHLPAKFLPALRAAGLGEDVIHTITVENPARFLAF
jgi:5-phospho-D-xylono-1,4-lactonase